MARKVARAGAVVTDRGELAKGGAPGLFSAQAGKKCRLSFDTGKVLTSLRMHGIEIGLSSRTFPLFPEVQFLTTPAKPISNESYFLLLTSLGALLWAEACDRE